MWENPHRQTLQPGPQSTSQLRAQCINPLAGLQHELVWSSVTSATTMWSSRTKSCNRRCCSLSIQREQPNSMPDKISQTLPHNFKRTPPTTVISWPPCNPSSVPCTSLTSGWRCQRSRGPPGLCFNFPPFHPTQQRYQPPHSILSSSPYYPSSPPLFSQSPCHLFPSLCSHCYTSP